MIFSWLQVCSFFAVMALTGWLVYPSEYFRGQMQREEGDRSHAIRFFTLYLAKHPYHKGATTSLTEAYEAAGRPEEAVEPLLAFYRHRRGDADTGFAVIALLERTGKQERAAAFRWELFRDLSDKPDAPRKRLETLAYTAYQRAAAAQDDAETTRALIALTEVSGEGSGYHGELLRLLLARGEFDKALRLLRDAVKQDPRADDPRRALARIMRLRGDVAGSLQELQAGLAAVPDSLGLRSDRAALNLSQKRWAQAEEDLLILMKRQPNEASWPREIARCLMEQGRIPEAVRLYEGLIQKAPDDRSRWWTVVYAYADRKMHPQAIAVLDRFLRRFPDDTQGIDMMVYQAELSGQFERAIAVLQRRAAAAPGDTARARSLANLLTQEDRTQEAAAVYERLVAKEPEDQDLWRTLAYIYERERDYKKAAGVLERYRERYPEDLKALDELAYDYQAMGEKGKVIELMRGHFHSTAARK